MTRSFFALAICHRLKVPEASARFGVLSVHLKHLLCSGAKLEEPEQHFITFCRKRVDGARPDFGMNAVDELPLHFGRQHRISERLPPRCEGPGELFEKMQRKLIDSVHAEVGSRSIDSL